MVRRLPIFRPCRVVLPPSAAANFVRDLRAFMAEPTEIKRDEIAARQLKVLERFRLPQERELLLSDVKDIFQEMKHHAGVRIGVDGSEKSRGSAPPDFQK